MKLLKTQCPETTGEEAPQDEVLDRARRLALKRKILKDSRINARSYIQAFSTPTTGE